MPPISRYVGHTLEKPIIAETGHAQTWAESTTPGEGFEELDAEWATSGPSSRAQYRLLPAISQAASTACRGSIRRSARAASRLFPRKFDAADTRVPSSFAVAVAAIDSFGLRRGELRLPARAQRDPNPAASNGYFFSMNSA